MSMANIRLTVEHNGVEYAGQVMRIKSTMLGYEDHGILTAYLTCESGSSGVSVGGFCLDQPKDKDARDYSRAGTAYGLDHLIRIIETVGASSWEKLPGNDVIVLYSGSSSSFWGSRSVGIAGVHNGKVLILQEHADSWREAAAVGGES